MEKPPPKKALSRAKGGTGRFPMDRIAMRGLGMYRARITRQIGELEKRQNNLQEEIESTRHKLTPRQLTEKLAEIGEIQKRVQQISSESATREMRIRKIAEGKGT